jgi:hypothetical protein
MAKKKEVNEKTFELNITAELLDLSKSFLWYLDESPLKKLYPRKFLKSFLSYNTFFAEGLTQAEESSTGGGYDVSINYKSPNQTFSNRLLFLQYKAGVNKTRCNNVNSNFNISQKHLRDTNHVLFTFNDAADKKQHGILRGLANTPSIQQNSVLYVFPRITSKTDFISKVGNLLTHTSFVSVSDIDLQASQQIPPIRINDGVVHKYRTSYDGVLSEVNFFFFKYKYDPTIFFEIMSELICIQIERLAHFLIVNNKVLIKDFKVWVFIAITDFISDKFKDKELEFALIIIATKVNFYLDDFNDETLLKSIPVAPQKFSTAISEDGLQFKTEEKIDMSYINYQIF